MFGGLRPLFFIEIIKNVKYNHLSRIKVNKCVNEKDEFFAYTYVHE
jgi:hypothetical protein